MPLWKPNTDRIGELIESESIRIDNAKRALQWNPPSDDLERPVTWGMNTVAEPPKVETPYVPTRREPFSFRDIVPTIEAPAEQITNPKPAASPEELKQPEDIPLWMRGLQWFGAPFEWIDENLIKPSLGAIGTGLTSLTGGSVGIPVTERQEGEDFWEWQRRSWEEWDSPTVMKIPVPWLDDKTWDIDVKGIMETVPWLIIPGPAGVATRLGKLGKVGEAVGRAIRYSPWGLVETGTSAALRGAVKAGSKFTTSLEKRIFGALPEELPTPPHAMRLASFLKEEVAPKYKEYRGELKTLRARQSADFEETFAQALREGKTPVEAQKLAAAARGGGVKQYYSVDPTAIRKDADALISDIWKANERGLVKADDMDAIRALLFEGEIPQPHHIRSLARIFGKEFAKEVSVIQGVPKTKWENVIDVLNIPRSVIAGFDVSAVGRQGLILGVLHPTRIPNALKQMTKAMISEKWAMESDDILRALPEANDFVKRGGYLAPLTDAELGAMEESFASTMARNIPGVRRSERGFNTYLNWLRVGAYADATKPALSMIRNSAEREQALTGIARFVDLASGRGTLPKNLERYAPALNTMFFSPRLQAATIELPFQIGKMLKSSNPYERKEAARALVSFMGGVGLLGLLAGTKVAKVENDPRSSDFGKIRFRTGKDANGNPVYSETRYDIWRGYLQYMRFLAQFASGERKSAYGNINKTNRGDVALRFLQSKSSPAMGLLADLMRNETYLGEPIFNDTTGFIKQAKERLVPLALQDIMDAIEENGANGAWSAIPAEIGIGTLTYVNDLVQVKNKIAKQVGKEKWSDLDPKTQREIENSNKELQTAMLEYDRRMMGTAWGDWRMAGNAIEDAFQNNVELATKQYRQTGDGLQFRDKVNDAFKMRAGAYDAREKDERFTEIARRQKATDPMELSVTLGPEQYAIKTYFDALYKDDMYDEFGDYRFDEAEIRKQQLQQMFGEELYQYVQDYMGEKYAVLPPEFQELAAAKKILKPYWDIRLRVEKLYGKMFADSPAGQRLISKLRRAEKASSPEMQKAYEKFYKR